MLTSAPVITISYVEEATRNEARDAHCHCAWPWSFLTCCMGVSTSVLVHQIWHGISKVLVTVVQEGLDLSSNCEGVI